MRVQALLIIASAALLPAAQAFAQAKDNYPTRSLRLIVPNAPGGASDFVARIIQPHWTEQLGQQVVIDNRGGAAGNIGLETTARSNPDGYTLMIGSNTQAINPSIYPSFPYTPLRHLFPVTQVADVPGSLVVHPSMPVKTVKELIAYAKQNEGKMNYGSSGPGSSPHLTTELFNSVAGIKMTHVPYKGVGQYITAQVSNEIQFSFANMFTTMPHWKAGRLRLVATTGSKRLEAMPDLPTVAEAGLPGFESLTWYAYMAPAKTPRAIV
ncbi:MAG: Bug family tripartite tricarboxylate transporter substrate binding protein, partial [Burkholderiales bacterium]